ncbi:MAG: aspartate-semialdehyde dehydrogenase [Caldithrix sp.]|nr:aspartate-semialdehyde dehydrogenase [Caldithrix sp.]
MNRHADKIAVGVLGATGSVGQKFIQLLQNHPYFEVTEVAASPRSAGRPYGQVVQWTLPGNIPKEAARLKLKECQPDLQCAFLFSGLDASVAGTIETDFARAGYTVVSNAKNHRFDADVPLMIPEVNADHLQLMHQQSYGTGKIITNPNCSTIGMVLALKPLMDAFGLQQVNAVTMQAISGAGFSGLAAASITDNVIPYIKGEEEKLETEPLKILGQLNGGKIDEASINISARCNRVPVIDGHLESIQVALQNKPQKKDLIECWTTFAGEPQRLKLPSAPLQPLYYFAEPHYPQPRLHRDIEQGMAVAIGGLRTCNLFDFKFNVLSHNTVRGAAGGAILCAELMKAKGYLQ